MCCVVFFFKQKTAYEMRISDWSSDVCSSDLKLRLRRKNGDVEILTELTGLFCRRHPCDQCIGTPRELSVCKPRHRDLTARLRRRSGNQSHQDGCTYYLESHPNVIFQLSTKTSLKNGKRKRHGEGKSSVRI